MYASFVSGFLFGYLLSLAPSTIAVWSFKAIVPFNIVGVAVRWAATGAVFMLAILTADYCDKPNINALKFILFFSWTLSINLRDASKNH
jgi:hypothetical protein